LFNAVTDAVNLLQTGDRENAMEILRTAQQNTEEAYLSAEE